MGENRSLRILLAASAGVGLLFLSLPPSKAAIAAAFGICGLLAGRWTMRGAQDAGVAMTRRGARDTGALSLKGVLDALPEPVVLVDARANVLVANAAAMSAFPGLKSGQPLSFGLRDPAILGAVGSCLRGAVSATAEIIERVPVERSFALYVARLSVAESPGTDKNAAVLVLRDTSQERRIETMRVDFVANASHELRTPLASILGFVETLQGAAKNDATARERFLGIMAEQARRMARLVDDLLSLSRIEMKGHIPPTDRIELAGVIRQTLESLSGMAQERGVVINLSGLPAVDVLGDRDELLRVFDNLIENAIKYGKSGGKVDIEISDGTGGDVAVAVRDYGPGIPQAHLPRLTERFYRVDTATSRSEGGTGLGLAIVKHIVSRHRGRLAIHSVVGAGATFTVTLPRMR